jgi:hypothetical protein
MKNTTLRPTKYADKSFPVGSHATVVPPVVPPVAEVRAALKYLNAIWVQFDGDNREEPRILVQGEYVNASI